MNLENIKSTTTWAEASGTMNNNNAKITEAIERLESAVEEGGGGGTADSVAWNKVTGKPSWITDSKPVYAKEDLSQGVQTSLDKADTALQAIPDGYATEEYTREQVRHILNLMSTALEGKVDKVDGKQLSTEDFTTALKEKLESLSSSGGGVDSEALKALSDRLDLIVSGGASGVIDSFVDIVAFLTGINDSVKLKDMLDTLRESVLRKQNTIEDLDAIRSGASLGATAVQRGESVAHAVSADSANLIKGVGGGLLDNVQNGMLQYSYSFEPGANGLFPATNWANAVINIGRHSGKYNSQLGFSSNGKLYYRVNKDAQDFDASDAWKELAFTSSKVASAANADNAANATTAQLSDKSILLQGVESDDFSGTDLELNMKLFSGISASAEGLFPYGSNANAVLTINKHRGNYNSQLGFSSNGLLYYRNGSNEVLTTQPWRRIMFEGDNIDRLRGVDGKVLIQSGVGYASIGDGYLDDNNILYINGKSIAMRSSDTTDVAINPSGDVDVTKNLKVAKNLTVNGATVTTSDVGTTIVYPWGVDIVADFPGISFFFGKSENITARLIEKVAGTLHCEGTFIAEHGLQSLGTIFSAGNMVSNGSITSGGHVYIPNNHGVVLFDTNGVPHRSLMMSTFNDLVIGHDTASASLPTFIDGNAIYFRYSNGHYTGMALNASGNVGIGTTEPVYKLDISHGGEGLRLLSQTDKSVMLIQNVGGMNWEVGAMNNNIFAIRSTVYGGNVITCNHEGKVGVGTTNLTHTLTVNGTASISGGTSITGKLSVKSPIESYSDSNEKTTIFPWGVDIKAVNPSVNFFFNRGDSITARLIETSQGTLTCEGSFNTTHGLQVGSWLTTGGDTTLGGKLNVSGNTTLGGNVAVSGTALISGHSLRCRVLRDGANQWIIGKVDDADGAIGVGSVNLTQPIKLENKNGNAVLDSDGKFSISGDVSIGGTLTLRDVRMSDAIAIRMGVGTTISEDYALSVGGDVSVSGYVMTEGVSMYSQRSLKDVVDEEGLSLEELATIKPTRFTWKDGRDEKVHIGGIADDVQKVLPEAVRETPEGILTMDYPVASFAVASSLVKPVTDHEERIAELERENKRLREELEMIKRYIGYGNDK